MNELMQLQEKANDLLKLAQEREKKIDLYLKQHALGDDYEKEKKLFIEGMKQYKNVINEIQILVYEKYV